MHLIDRQRKSDVASALGLTPHGVTEKISRVLPGLRLAMTQEMGEELRHLLQFNWGKDKKPPSFFRINPPKKL